MNLPLKMPGEDVLRPMAALQQVKPAKPQSSFSLPVFLTADFLSEPPGKLLPSAHNRWYRPWFALKSLFLLAPLCSNLTLQFYNNGKNIHLGREDAQNEMIPPGGTEAGQGRSSEGCWPQESADTKEFQGSLIWRRKNERPADRDGQQGFSVARYWRMW